MLWDTVLVMNHRIELYTLDDIFNANANPFAQDFPKRYAVAHSSHPSTVQFSTSRNVALISPV